MPKIMKSLNNISRCQGIFRTSKLKYDDLCSGHYSFLLAICKKPGSSQEELSKEICVSKSTIARTMTYLEDKGYIYRETSKNDKRQFGVFPTEKLLSVIDDIRKVTRNWNELITEGISEKDMEVFHFVLSCMEIKAKEIIENQEEKGK